MNLPHVTVIIPARNEAKLIGGCLKALKDLDYPDYSIIVVDNGSTDDTSLIARELDVVVLWEPHQGRGRARNIGLKNAHSEWVAFVDADCVVERNWLKELVTNALTMNAQVAQGPIIPEGEVESSLSRFRYFRLHKKTQGTMSFLTQIGKNSPLLNGAAFVAKKSSMEDIEGFDEALVRHQDIDLGRRLFLSGNDFLFVPEAKARVYFKGGWTSYLMRSYEVGKYKKIFNAKWKQEASGPSALVRSLKGHITQFLKSKDLRWTLMMFDELLLYVGEYCAPEPAAEKYIQRPRRPAFLMLKSEVVYLHESQRKWIKLDWVSGQVFRLMMKRTTITDLNQMNLVLTDEQLVAYEDELRDLMKESFL